MGIKVGMVSLGCPKNQVDGEVMLGFLQQEGFVITNRAREADAVIINTCGFIEDAKTESIETILEYCELKKSTKIRSVVVTGCLAERYREEIANEIPEADVVLGLGENKQIAAAIRKSLGEKGHVYAYGDKYNLPLEGKRVVSTQPILAYLKIAEGCDNNCTYCAIPMIRGHFRSRTMESILAEAEVLAAGGVREMVVVAQDTSRYGEDLYGVSKLPELLGGLAKIADLHWIRVLYCYPERITDDLLTVMASEPKILPYLDIPIQHCNARVLKRMNRKGDRQWLQTLVEHIRKMVPGITLRTTLIAGFPGETEAEFEELCQFVKDMAFDRLGCFAYSIEEDTPAALLDGQLDEHVKQRRAEVVMDIQREIALDKAAQKVGRTDEVLIEYHDKGDNTYVGRTRADAPEIDCHVRFTAERPLEVGQFVNVLMTSQSDIDLIGHAAQSGKKQE